MGNEYSYTPKESLSGALASGIGGSLPALVNPYGSTGSNLAAVLGGSLLAGLFGYSAKKEAEQKNAEMMPVMMDLLQAKDTGTIADILKTSPYGQRLSPIGISRMSALEEAQAKREAAALERQQALGDFATKEQIRDKFIKGRRIPQSDKAPVIPAQIRNQVAGVTGTANLAIDIADQIQAFENIPEFAAARNLTGLPDQIKTDLQQLGLLHTRAMSGLATTDSERATVKSITQGDWSSITPANAISLLRKFQRNELNVAAQVYETSLQKPGNVIKEMRRAAKTGTKIMFSLPQEEPSAQTPTAPATKEQKASPPKRADYQSAAEFLAAVKAWRGQ